MLTKKKPLTEMTPQRARVAIARDVIKHLGVFKATKGAYLYFNDAVRDLYSLNADAQKHIDVLSKGCEACAVGACMLSMVRLFNKAKIKHMKGASVIKSKLRKYFDIEQLELIESYFEGWYVEGIDYNKIDHFYTTYPVNSDRLRVIMKNIIKHRGTFKPEKEVPLTSCT